MSCPENQYNILPPPHPTRRGGGEVLEVKKKKVREISWTVDKLIKKLTPPVENFKRQHFKVTIGKAIILNDYTNILGKTG